MFLLPCSAAQQATHFFGLVQQATQQVYILPLQEPLPIIGIAEALMAAVEVHSRCVVAPAPPGCSSSRRMISLSTFDLQMRAIPPTRRVLFYRKSDIPLEDVVARLKASLATALLHFFPLAGRFHIGPDNVLSLHCNDVGADFIVASTEAELPDFSSPADDCPCFPNLVPLSALPPDSPLVPPTCVQVTRFSCGSIAIGCSVSHILVDGTSLWHFLTSWAALSRGDAISSTPVHQRFQTPSVAAPGSGTAPPPPPRNVAGRSTGTGNVCGAAIFLIPQTTIQGLKAEATHGGKLPFSTFISVMAWWWKHVTQVRSLELEQEVRFHFGTDGRRRLNPPLPPEYFGNAVMPIYATSSAGEIVSNDVAFAANLLHRAVAAVDDSSIKDYLRRVEEVGCPGPYSEFVPGVDMAAGSSVRFPMYQSDFGWGQPVAVRQGLTPPYVDGLFLCDPGVGPGSFAFTACLDPQTIATLRAAHTSKTPHLQDKMP